VFGLLHGFVHRATHSLTVPSTLDRLTHSLPAI